MELHPQQNFTIVRQLADHTDLNTYYVQSVIRNARTDEIIATLNLEDKGDQRFKKDWRVPPDPSGEGFYVSIVTSTYSDSGYATKSPSYGDVEDTYLVIDRGMNVGGKGGSGPSLRDIRDVVKEELAKRDPKPFKIEKTKIPKQEKIELKWDEVLSAIEGLGNAIAKLPQDKVDLAPVLEAVGGVKEAVDAIEIPELDLSPLEEQLAKHDNESAVALDKAQTSIEKVLESLPGKIGKILTTILQKLNFVTSSVTFLDDKRPMMHKLNLGEEKLSEAKKPEVKLY